VKRTRGALASLLAVIVTVCDGKASSALAVTSGADAADAAGATGGDTGGDTTAAAGGTLALCSGAGTAGGGACSWAWPSDTTHNHPAQAIHVRMHFFQ